MARSSTTLQPGTFAAAQAAGVAARRRKAEIRAGLRGGTLRLEQLLVPAQRGELTAQAERMQVDQLLRWCPGMGERRIAHALSEMQLQPATRVSDLDPAHRRALVAVANAYQPRET
ncbi:MAG: hypothetical protein ITG02_01115 [Patulibacter sp.]|nr:hypothetical protein [Patulibacter sp.]